MALIGKIRKNFWFVLILLGLALAAFILMDMTSASNMGGAGAMSVGKVAGKKLDYREFQTVEQSYYGGSSSDVFTKRNTIWDFFVERALVENEAADLGLKVGRDELMDLQFGASPSPIITANWRNPQTGQMDLASLNSIKSSIENNEEMNPKFRQYWAEQEKHVIKDKLQNKLNMLVNKAIYTPSWLAENHHKEDNDKVDFGYVKIPFDKVDDTSVELTDADYKNFITSKAHLYENKEETRVLEYAVFDVVATKQDTMMWQDSIQAIKAGFATTANDSLYSLNHNGTYAGYYFRIEDLPEGARSFFEGREVGDVVGPYTENNAYNLIKIIDKKIVPDSVSASHILLNADRNDKAALATANSKMDSIISRYKSGAETFSALAIANSQDASNASKGGDLGTFAQGSMVPEFNDACFILGKSGGAYKVITQYGIHFVKVNNQIFNTRAPKYKVTTAGLPIVPSEETQNNLFDKVSDLITDNRDIEKLKEQLKSENITLTTSVPVERNAFKMDKFEATQTTREMVKWAFDEPTEIGDVSPEVYTFTDKALYYNNKYVIATLKEITPAGLPTVSSMKETLKTLVMNQKKGSKIASELKFSSLEDAASQYAVQVDTAKNVSFKGAFIPGIGNEQEVLANAFGLENMSISKPIIGTSGVYVVQPISKQAAGPVGNVSFIKTNASSEAKSRVQFSLMEALKKKAKIEDNRFTFF